MLLLMVSLRNSFANNKKQCILWSTSFLYLGEYKLSYKNNYSHTNYEVVNKFLFFFKFDQVLWIFQFKYKQVWSFFVFF